MARHVKGGPRPAPPARAVGRARPWPKLQYVSSGISLRALPTSLRARPAGLRNAKAGLDGRQGRLFQLAPPLLLQRGLLAKSLYQGLASLELLGQLRWRACISSSPRRSSASSASRFSCRSSSMRSACRRWYSRARESSDFA